MTQINRNVTEQRDRDRDSLARAGNPFGVVSRCHGVTDERDNRDVTRVDRDSTALRPTRHAGNTEDFTKPQSDLELAQEQQNSGDAEVLKIIGVIMGAVFGLLSAGWLIKLAFERMLP